MLTVYALPGQHMGASPVFLQAVEEQGEENKDNEFGGGVLRKRQRTTAQKQQSGGEDLQQVSLQSPVA